MKINGTDPKPPAALALILAVGLFFTILSGCQPYLLHPGEQGVCIQHIEIKDAVKSHRDTLELVFLAPGSGWLLFRDHGISSILNFRSITPSEIDRWNLCAKWAGYPVRVGLDGDTLCVTVEEVD